MSSKPFNRSIKYHPDPAYDAGQTSEYHLYDDEIFCSGMTGLPENMDFNIQSPSIDSVHRERDGKHNGKEGILRHYV